MKNQTTFTTPLIEAAREYVTEYTGKHFPDAISYHNIDHVNEVARASEEIGKAIGLGDKELEIVLIAALFHDIGYYKGQTGHERKSAKIATDFLLIKEFSKEKIDRVVSCILATKVPQNPKNILDQVLCDADLYHLGSYEFVEKSDELWGEMKSGGTDLTFYEWLKTSRDFLKSHQYHTSYAREVLKPKKEENLRQLERRIAAIKKKN